MTEPTPTRGDILADAFRGIASAVQRAAASTRDDYALAPPGALMPRQDATVRPLETPAGVDAGMETPEGAAGAQAGADAAQADRWSRREQLGVLLSRMQRGRLLDAERPLLRAAVERELTDAWQQQAAENARLRDERDRARRIAVELEQQLARATAQITAN